MAHTPDWSKAPEWAEWWAADKNGESYWYERKPVKHIIFNFWHRKNDDDKTKFSGIVDGVDFLTSLQKRP